MSPSQRPPPPGAAFPWLPIPHRRPLFFERARARKTAPAARAPPIARSAAFLASQGPVADAVPAKPAPQGALAAPLQEPFPVRISALAEALVARPRGQQQRAALARCPRPAGSRRTAPPTPWPMALFLRECPSRSLPGVAADDTGVKEEALGPQQKLGTAEMQPHRSLMQSLSALSVPLLVSRPLNIHHPAQPPFALRDHSGSE
mmetsp:Transcript_82498/g.197947  ORF Transcript_82498/g.197947 Transcript_82498/m.197947 type:complete len:204 (-) Transcript_82498:1017-1628(-)